MRELTIISMSGGLDSATLCAEALSQGKDVFVLNFNYGQKNIVEMRAFENLLQYFKGRKEIHELPGKIIGNKELDLTSLFGEFLDIWAQMRDSGEIKKQAEHEFYTPSRNLLFAVMSTVVGEIIALAKNYDTVYIGLGIHQHSEAAYGEHRNYWDITPTFADKLNQLLALNNVKNVKLFAPFANSFKKDIVKRAVELRVPYKLTWTCYNPQLENGKYVPCKKCEACIERQLAGDEADVKDINEYSIKE